MTDLYIETENLLVAVQLGQISRDEAFELWLKRRANEQ